MANIKVPPLPTNGSVQYGPYCAATDRAIIDVVSSAMLADLSTIYLPAISAETTPYVNAWLKATGQSLKVETYWRTKELRVVATDDSIKVSRPKRTYRPLVSSAPVTSVAAPIAVASPAPVVVETTAPVVVATTSTAVVTTTSAIPAPAPKVHVKRRRIDGVEYATIGHVTVEAKHHDTLVDALAAVNAGQVASVLITGPSGTAKTLLVRSFAASVGLPFIKVDGGGIRTADDWFGALRQDPNTKAWDYAWSPFGQALVSGTPCVVLLDEANRSETPQALNAGLGLLDETATHYVADARITVSKPVGMLIVVTANKGAEYVGTVPFDAAVTQRFGSGIRLEYPPVKVEVAILTDLTGVDEKTAGKLVNMANQQRTVKDDVSQFPSGVGISTRMLVDICRRMKRSGTSVNAAIESCFSAQFEVEDSPALKNVVEMHFPPSVNDTLDVDTGAINEAE